MSTTSTGLPLGWTWPGQKLSVPFTPLDPVRIFVEDPTSRLIVTLRRTIGWTAVLDDLRNADQFDCRFEGMLADRLSGLASGSALRELEYQFVILRCAPGDEFHAASRIMARHSGTAGNVIAVEPDGLLRFSMPSIGLPFHLAGQHGQYLSMLNVPTAHLSTTGNGVRVAIVDTGADLHSAKDFYDVLDLSGVHPGLPSQDQDGHGTAMATIVQQVAPDADLFVIRISNQAQATLLDAMAGVSAAVVDCRADIVNLSFGFPGFGRGCIVCGASPISRSIALESLLRTLFQTYGGIYVAAAGNDGLQSTEFEYPGAYDFSIVVGALDSRCRRSRFSQYRAAGGHKRYAMAPGGQKDALGNVVEDVGSGTKANCLGTSVATAYFSGMLALFRAESRYRSMARDAFIDDVLANRCVPHSSGVTKEYGCGMIRYS